MRKSVKFSAFIALVLLCASLFCLTLPTFADTAPAEETTVEETAAETEAETEAETTAAEKVAKPVSDVSNIIGIIVAVIIGVGAIVAIVMLAPKNTAPKKK